MFFSKKKSVILCLFALILTLSGCNKKTEEVVNDEVIKDTETSFKEVFEASEVLRKKALSPDGKGITGSLEMSIETDSGSLFDYNAKFKQKGNDARADVRLLINGKEVKESYIKNGENIFVADINSSKENAEEEKIISYIKQETTEKGVSSNIIGLLCFANEKNISATDDKKTFILNIDENSLKEKAAEIGEYFKSEEFKNQAKKQLTASIKLELLELGLKEEDEKKADKIIEEEIKAKLESETEKLANFLSNSEYYSPKLNIYLEEDGFIGERKLNFIFKPADGLGELLGIKADLPDEMKVFVTLREENNKDTEIDFSPLEKIENK